MATFFLNTELQTETRFDMAVFMEDTDSLDPLTSEFLRLLPTLETYGRYTIQDEESRPDLLSFRIYGNTQYWWILLMYNQIIDVESLTIDKVISYPSLGDLETLYFSLSAKERATS